MFQINKTLRKVIKKKKTKFPKKNENNLMKLKASTEVLSVGKQTKASK